MVMLKALKDIKPAVERTTSHFKHHMKTEEYKRNLSKFKGRG